MSTFLDHAATTPVRPLALDAYLEALAHLGNPSSVHAHGRETRELLEQARELLAKSADCNLAEVVFTSGGSEANNLAIKGFFWQRQEQRPRKYVISALTEHHAVIDPIEWLEKHEGAQLLWLPVDKTGQPDLETYQGWLSQYGDEIALVSLMWVNNETGAIWDIPAMAALASEFGIPVHSDAVAAFGHTEISFKDSNLAAMSVSGHKLGAPIGVGALIVSRSQKPISLIHGGGQERGLRSGTMNYPHAFSLAMASKLAVADMAVREARLESLRNQLEEKVLSQIPQAQKTISGPRIGHTASFIFPGVQSDSLIFLLDQKGISVSAGSACQAGVLSASHVLLAMGYSEAEASGVLRVTLGHTTTDEDIDVFTSSILEVYQTALRAGLNR
ncbi:MAG: hypothetical protein RI929_341 [Actinomycetota bacterium]|jgi:cysteine desulfurase